MLLDDESEAELKEAALALANGYAILLTGRELTVRIQGRARAIVLPSEARTYSILQQAYIAGKAARSIGVAQLKAMNADQVSAYIRENSIVIDELDEAVLARLTRDTHHWVEGRGEAWKTAIGTVLANTDREYAAAIVAETYSDVAQVSQERQRYLARLGSQLGQLLPTFESDALRLLQTETSTYFQHGQTTGRSKDESVWKVPRAGCCIHCDRLHSHRNGKPKKYRLGDVQGNSNWGRKAADWRFTIGPTHPHCYCVLYYESDEKAGNKT